MGFGEATLSFGMSSIIIFYICSFFPSFISVGFLFKFGEFILILETKLREV